MVGRASTADHARQEPSAQSLVEDKADSLDEAKAAFRAAWQASAFAGKSRPDMLNLSLSGHDPEVSLTLKFRRQLQACGKLMKDAALDTRGA